MNLDGLAVAGWLTLYIWHLFSSYKIRLFLVYSTAFTFAKVWDAKSACLIARFLDIPKKSRLLICSLSVYRDNLIISVLYGNNIWLSVLCVLCEACELFVLPFVLPSGLGKVSWPRKDEVCGSAYDL